MSDTQDDIINISQPPQDVLKTQFLTRQNEALEYIREYLRRKAHSNRAFSSVDVRASVQTLFYDLKPHLETNLGEKNLKALRENVFSTDCDKVIEGYEEINSFLYKINLKRIDTRKKYDSTNAEEENRAVNL